MSKPSTSETLAFIRFEVLFPPSLDGPKQLIKLRKCFKQCYANFNTYTTTSSANYITTINKRILKN